MNAVLAVLIFAGIGGGYYLYKNKGAGVESPVLPVSDGGLFDFLGDVMSSETRGIRNKNPGNIMWNSVNNWDGQVGKDAQGFSVFSDPKYGIRAMNKLLNTYAVTGRNTAESIIKSWTVGDSAVIQNNYISKIVQMTGKSKDAVLGAGDRLNLIKAIILFENANRNPYGDSEILAAMAMK